ncbi:LOW QUALITY PROTEIN: 3-oxoacyl-[acyl-carrier protein] reductase [Halarchaeum acidiphilum MH1-52-1]|uniref:3-oxoacyl-[acyl-carrier protein] reductase n=1 Tax=Halarchaeum acidiphilum MH1-52-1 TaxID=1261545 RepID=U3A371_9EURY|nr:LOW QUALITY PROTEIN: 3-oxoacyl-[acyl-carrier protein] reductase [Halarchaeum acidiphilum MH1-52-1]
MGRITGDFAGETVIVTGGASGIGRAVARRFGDAGATVLVADLDPEPNTGGTRRTKRSRRLAERRRSRRRTSPSRPTSRPSSRRPASFGGVDVMVNNAGYHAGGPLLDLDVAELRRALAVNVEGVFVGTQVAARDMIDRDEPGSVVNTASISSEVAQFEQVGYDASKGAVKMVTRGSALELAEYGIRVNAVAPGQIATEFVEGWSEEAPAKAASDDLLKPVPLGRAGVPDDLAAAYLYLASEDASYVTGELLFVDGGWQVL